MLFLFIFLSIIQNIVHQTIVKYFVEIIAFLFLKGYKMQMKMSFMVLEIWLFGFGKVLENCFKGVCTLLSLIERGGNRRDVCSHRPILNRRGVHVG